MHRPYIILSTACSVDGRVDIARPTMLSNRLQEYRVQELRGTVDAVLTSAEKITVEDPEFPVKDSPNKPKIVVIDKLAETPVDSKIMADPSKKVMLVTCKKAHPNRIHRLQKTKSDLAVMELGEHAVNLEDMMNELNRAGIKKILLDADYTVNMRFLSYKLVDEIYLLVAPVILGQEHAQVFDGKLHENIGLNLDGIIQYGDHLVMHYKLIEPSK
ncbi:MAG: dihydrofolate reductase family protein [Candidatus Altiarchaeota archaeon]|nr:dihydrofolate reductase family protein [Candidatus Altiarchaeota archaeon]